jgi:hypothetical protein
MMTINPRRLKYFSCIVILLVTRLLPGQQKDFQTWWELSVDKDLKNGFEISGELEQRFRNNSLQYDRTLVTLAGSYDIRNFLQLSAGVRAVAVADREIRLHDQYRIHADALGRYSFSGLDLSLRIRMQYGFEDVPDMGYFSLNNLVNRNRLKLDHHIFGTRMGLFASIETWHLLNQGPSRLTYKMRYSVGLDYDLSFVSRLTLRYILEDEFNVRNPLQSHVFLVGFSHTL